MAAPKYEIIQKTYQNPHATEGLKLNVMVVENTPEDVIHDNIRYSSERYPKWLEVQEPHDIPAVFIGSGGSINSHIEDILKLQEDGATVFATNAASKWARDNKIWVDYQVIVDAQKETADLVDPGADEHLFASQCHPDTLERASSLTLFHLMMPDIEDLFPEERVKQGGYVLLGGGTTAGITALSVAYSQGYRKFHVFGYDSSYANGKSHGFDQPMNAFMPTTEIEWGGKKFEVSVAMKSQAEGFPIYANTLKNAGCEFHVYGEGLLQTIYNTKYEDMSEREKYQAMWKFPAYRTNSPGEQIAELFAEKFKPDGLVVDYGCGTGRGSLKLMELGIEVLSIDFADNCRDQEAIALPFIQHDLTEPLRISAPYGFCTDVMEHIPTDDVVKVIANIMNASERVFFQISTIDDMFGWLIEKQLHLTIKPHDWWVSMFDTLGYQIEWEQEEPTASLFYIFNPDRREI